ncbi:MAG: PHP domain-containing protein [Planctomycetes bacterium]|nr:PHP domain-containing protein [Planctomycetota bacterium]
MPARQPFTALCRALAAPPSTQRVDLHLHTTFSDGLYSPAQVVDLGRRSGLAGLAITDHDTVAGLGPAREAAQGSGLEIIAGVEISAEYQGREFHLLGYFFRPEDATLQAALERLRRHRAERFQEMVERLRRCGVRLDEEDLPQHAEYETLGRRHLAELLVKHQRAGSIREAFARYLGDEGRATVPKLRLPVAEALALVRQAGGVASWAHPGSGCTWEDLAALGRLGLGAVEAVYPGYRPAQVRRLREWAAALGLAVTGGSDCHGPDPLSRTVGACTVTGAELEQLRHMASG